MYLQYIASKIVILFLQLIFRPKQQKREALAMAIVNEIIVLGASLSGNC